MPPDSLQTWQHAEQLLAGGRHDAARAAYTTLLDDPRWVLPARLRLSAVAAEQGRLRESVAQALAAHAAREDDPVMLEALCGLLVDNGELEAAVDCATAPALKQARDPRILAGVAQRMADQSFPQLARPLLEQARRMGLDGAPLRHQLGQAAAYAGDTDEADAQYEACLRLDPGFAPAWRDLAKLRRQTADHHHVDRLRAALSRAVGTPVAPLLHYALFKELDDLGDTAAAWVQLEAGMRARRAQVQFDPAAEAALFDELRALPAGSGGAGQGGPEAPAAGGPVPIFIVGQPRSGTTLLERILGSHPQVADAGELRDFNFQLRWLCDRIGPPQPDLELVRAAREVDFAELGRRYLSHTQWQAGDRPFYTDKLPANFVHAGHIARALPQARILHMVRGPMDTCFSNLKELFGEAYPHSYDQAEMAGHFQRYRALMAHFHQRFPGRILDVDYDALVADPQAVAGRVLEFCGLPWDPGVVDIQSRGGVVATASAAQVREPIHQRFVGQWRRYASRLQPLRDALGEAAGADAAG